MTDQILKKINKNSIELEFHTYSGVFMQFFL